MISLPDFMEAVTPVVQASFLFLALLWGMKTALWALKAIGLCEMSIALETKYPWGPFIPFIRDYAVADLACQHRKSSAVQRSARVILPLLSVFSVVFAVVGLYLSMNAGMNLLVAAENAIIEGQKMTAADFTAINLAALPFLISLVLLLFHRILWLWCFYRICTIFAPGSAALYLMIAFFFPFLEGVILYSARANTPNMPRTGGENAIFFEQDGT